MTIERWNPLAEIRRMDETLDRFRRRFPDGTRADGQWAAPVDVVRDGDNILVKASLPGVEAEKIDVTLDGKTLVIKAATAAEPEDQGDGYLLRERRTGVFHRALRLPGTVDFDKAESTYKDGVLTVTLPTREKANTRRLEVIAA